MSRMGSHVLDLQEAEMLDSQDGFPAEAGKELNQGEKYAENISRTSGRTTAIRPSTEDEQEPSLQKPVR